MARGVRVDIPGVRRWRSLVGFFSLPKSCDMFLRLQTIIWTTVILFLFVSAHLVTLVLEWSSRHLPFWILLGPIISLLLFAGVIWYIFRSCPSWQKSANLETQAIGSNASATSTTQVSMDYSNNTTCPPALVLGNMIVASIALTVTFSNIASGMYMQILLLLRSHSWCPLLLPLTDNVTGGMLFLSIDFLSTVPLLALL